MKRYDEIIKIIEKSKPGAGRIEKTSNLYTDLGFDSLGFVKLLLDIEEKYSIIFELVEMERCLQLDQLVALVENKVEESRHD